MKQFIVLVFFISLAAAQPSDMLEFPISEAINANVPLQTGSDKMIELTLTQGSSDLEVQLASQRQTLPINYLNEGYTAPASLLVADFNFDGYRDLALPETEGYGGVNYFYSLYVYTPEGFEFLPLPEAEWACNPYLNNETKTLETSCKSGPSYYQQHFRFADGKPYLSMETGTLSMDAVDGFFFRQDEFDANGNKINSTIVSGEDGENPATGTILWDKVYLFSEADKTKRTEDYLVRGDEVEVLALSEDNLWVSIAYTNEQGERQTAWIKPQNISLY
jgi:hypothetical protein